MAFHQQAVSVVAFSPDGSRILTGDGDGMIQLRRYKSAQPRCLEIAHRANVGVVGVSPDGRIGVSGTKPIDKTAGEVQIWDTSTGRSLGHVTHSDIITAVAFSRDGRILATASADHTAQLVDVASGKILCPPLAHPGVGNFAGIQSAGYSSSDWW